MQIFKGLAVGLAAVSMVGAPIAAQAAAPAEVSRVGADIEGENLRGGFIIPLVAIIAIILGVVAFTGDDDDDAPHSP